MVSVCAPHGRDGRHVGDLRARDARHQHAGQELDHGARHARHLDQRAQEDEERHRQQHQVRHAFVQPPDHDLHRRIGGLRQIRKRRQRELERDGHAREHGGGHDADEKDHQVDLAQPLEERLRQPEHGYHHGHPHQRHQHLRQRLGAQQAQHGHHGHQAHAHRNG
ncbi:hypothetical protein G6F22_017644 [Rhizopus arrhizus]|nr:hypothetical protein G6F22_017644 [Rhizopus arrhizus]